MKYPIKQSIMVGSFEQIKKYYEDLNVYTGLDCIKQHQNRYSIPDFSVASQLDKINNLTTEKMGVVFFLEINPLNTSNEKTLNVKYECVWITEEEISNTIPLIEKINVITNTLKEKNIQGIK